MRVAVEIITPEVAQGYLARNKHNRAMRRGLVERYAESMKRGEWRATHQGIAFDASGYLLDGQHRLKAIIDSGCAVQMTVARDVETGSQLVMDDHAKRSASDALTLARQERVTQTEVAIIKCAVEFNSQVRSGVRYLTKQQLSDLVDVFRTPLDFVASHMTDKQRGVTASPVQAAVCLAWFYVHDLERLEEFVRVIMGRSLPDGERDRAAVIVREWLLRNGMVGGYGPRYEAFCKTQRAISAFMEGRPLGKLYGNTVRYPWPLVDAVRS